MRRTCRNSKILSDCRMKYMSFLIVDDNSVMRRTIGRVVGDLTDRIIE